MKSLEVTGFATALQSHANFFSFQTPDIRIRQNGGMTRIKTFFVYEGVKILGADFQKSM